MQHVPNAFPFGSTDSPIPEPFSGACYLFPLCQQDSTVQQCITQLLQRFNQRGNSGPVIHRHVCTVFFDFFHKTVEIYYHQLCTNICNVYLCNISVMHWSVIVWPANQEQRKVWGPALEKVQFNSHWNQHQLQWTSVSFEGGLTHYWQKVWNTHVVSIWSHIHDLDKMFYLDAENTETEKKVQRNSQWVTLCALPLPPRWAQLNLSFTLQMLASVSTYHQGLDQRQKMIRKHRN